MLPDPKDPYQKKTDVVKKGGGGLSFLTKSKKKKQFFTPPLIMPHSQQYISFIMIVTISIIGGVSTSTLFSPLQNSRCFGAKGDGAGPSKLEGRGVIKIEA